MQLSARALKATIVLNPSDLVGTRVPDGASRFAMTVQLPDRTIHVDLNVKSLRKAVATVNSAGAANVAVILQGKLLAGDVLAEAGISAQPKVTPAAAPRVAAMADA
jgi:hypothetical protein